MKGGNQLGIDSVSLRQRAPHKLDETCRVVRERQPKGCIDTIIGLGPRQCTEVVLSREA